MINEKEAQDTTKNLFVLLLITLVILMKYGYRFMGGNQTQYLLASFAQMKPNFAPNDWFMWQTTAYYPVFTWLVVFMNKYLSLDFGVFGVWLAYIFFFVFSVQQLIKSLIDDERVFYLCLILAIFSLERGWSVGYLFGNLLQPSTMAVPFFVMSLVFLIKKNYILSGIFLGLCSLIQPQYGVLGTLLYGIYFALKYRTIRFTNMVKFGISFLCLSSYYFWRVFTTFFYGDRLSAVEDYKILLWANPHQYAPSTWALSLHIKMFIIIGLAIYAASTLRHKLRDNILLDLSGIILFLCVVSVFFSEVFFNAFIAMLYFWRFVSFLMVFCYIYGAVLIIDLLDQPRLWAKFSAGILIILYLSLSNSVRLLLSHKIYAIIFPTVSLGILIIHSILKKYNFKGVAPLAIFVLPFITFQLFGINQVSFRPQQIHKHIYNEHYEEVLAWVRNNTKPEDNFIIPPKEEGFRLRTGRGILVNWRCIPYKGNEIREWKKRMLAVKDYARVYELKDWRKRLDDKDYDQLTPVKIKKVAQEYNMTYFLARKSQENQREFLAEGFEVPFQNAGYIVYKVAL